MQTGEHGMVTMDESLADKYRQGLISYEVALAQAFDPSLLRTLIEPDDRSSGA
jgi:Tfp pilus assembly pilus retraction ATPase PilT